MSNPLDVRPISVAVYFLPVETRVPLKFGAETVTAVTCARVWMRVQDRRGRVAEGWGETPLAVQWGWPSQTLSYDVRNAALKQFCLHLARAWANVDVTGHPLEIGHAFQTQVLPMLLKSFTLSLPPSVPPLAGGSSPSLRAGRGLGGGVVSPPPRQVLERGPGGEVSLPRLAALICCSAFDNALHDAYGVLHEQPVYQTYRSPFMNADLTHYLDPAPTAAGEPQVSFAGLYPQDFLVFPRRERLPAWHLVGGLDLLTQAECTGDEPEDGYPVVLTDWIARDGLKCLKIKLRGTDAAWDYERLVAVGDIALARGVDWLTSDFNCTVTDPAYVNTILDRLLVEHPRIYGMLLYVEQPFPYDLEQYRVDVRSVSARKPLFMDESAHDWRLVALGRALGWTGVALKTCKTQTGALLSLCWAKAHGLTLMVQDLTNPMLAQIPHVLLAAHAGTIMGVETNAMQFYPDASLPEAEVHPGVYTRRDGQIDLSTVRGPGFGYQLAHIQRALPDPALVV